VHSALKMTPRDALKEERKAEVFMNIYDKQIRAKPQKPKLKLHQPVRISKERLLFQKASSSQLWTSEIYR